MVPVNINCTTFTTAITQKQDMTRAVVVAAVAAHWFCCVWPLVSLVGYLSAWLLIGNSSSISTYLFREKYVWNIFSLLFRNGYGHHLDRLFPSQHGFILRDNQTGLSPGDRQLSDANHKCTVRLTQQERSQHLENCDTCFKARYVHHISCSACCTLFIFHNAETVRDGIKITY